MGPRDQLPVSNNFSQDIQRSFRSPIETTEKTHWCRQHTNGTDDRGAAVVLRRHHIGVELRMPFQLHPVAQMVERAAGRHFNPVDKNEVIVGSRKVGSIRRDGMGWNGEKGEEGRERS